MKSSTTKRRTKGAGSLKKRAGKYYLRIRTDGGDRMVLVRDEYGQPVTDYREAQRCAMLPIPQKQPKPQKAAEYSLADIWDVYLRSPDRPQSGKQTLVGYHSALKHFIAYLAGNNAPETIPVRCITPVAIAGFFAHIWEAGSVSGRTYNSYRQGLKLIFRCTHQALELPDNLVHNIKSRPARSISHKEFTQDEVQQLFRALDAGELVGYHRYRPRLYELSCRQRPSAPMGRRRPPTAPACCHRTPN